MRPPSRRGPAWATSAVPACWRSPAPFSRAVVKSGVFGGAGRDTFGDDDAG